MLTTFSFSLFRSRNALVIFGKATGTETNKIKEVLDTYCYASGQRVNHDKSSLFFGKGCPDLIKQSIKQILEVPNESLNDKYLGLPSDVGRSKNGAFGYQPKGSDLEEIAGVDGKGSLGWGKGNFDQICCTSITNLLDGYFQAA